MTATPKRITALALEIYRFAADRIAGADDRVWSRETIESIILKHYPDDRGTEKLVKALKRARWLYDELSLSPLGSAAKYGDTYEPPTKEQCLDIREIMETALAEYEGKQKEDDGYETFVRNQEK